MMNKLFKGLLLISVVTFFACSGSKKVVNNATNKVENYTENARTANKGNTSMGKMANALNLTNEQKVKMDAIKTWFKTEKQNIFKDKMGNKTAAKTAMIALLSEKNNKVKQILNKEQFSKYIAKEAEKSNGERNGELRNKGNYQERVDTRKNMMYQKIGLNENQIAQFEAINEKYKKQFYNLKFKNEVANRSEQFDALQKQKELDMQKILNKDQFEIYKSTFANKGSKGGMHHKGGKMGKPNMGSSGIERPRMENMNTTKPEAGSSYNSNYKRNSSTMPSGNMNTTKPEAGSSYNSNYQRNSSTMPSGSMNTTKPMGNKPANFEANIPASILKQLNLSDSQSNQINSIMSVAQMKLRDVAQQNVGNQNGYRVAMKNILGERRTAIQKVLTSQQFLMFLNLMKNLKGDRRTKG